MLGEGAHHVVVKESHGHAWKAAMLVHGLFKYFVVRRPADDRQASVSYKLQPACSYGRSEHRSFGHLHSHEGPRVIQVRNDDTAMDRFQEEGRKGIQLTPFAPSHLNASHKQRITRTLSLPHQPGWSFFMIACLPADGSALCLQSAPTAAAWCGRACTTQQQRETSLSCAHP